MLSFVETHRLKGANSQCRISGGWRTVPIEWLFNNVLPRLSPPPFPGFNVFVDREAYFDAGGLTSGPHEDMTLSRTPGKQCRTDACAVVLVDTSDRRVKRACLMGPVGDYKELEYQRQLQSRLAIGP